MTRVTKKNRHWLTIYLIGCFALSSLSCGDKDDDSETEETDETTTTSTSGGTSSTTTFDTPNYEKPDVICGLPGFKYLLTDYFYPHCNECHGSGDIASADPDAAYESMITIEDDTLRRVVTSGEFCVDDCRLAEGDAILDDIDTWAPQKNSCP